MSSVLAQEQKAGTETLPQIIKRIQPSTVVVLTYDEKGEPIAQGSGFFVSRAGHIITNRHVLEAASRAEIKTSQGKVYPISHIIAEDKEGDLVLASVDIPASSVQPLKLSDTIPQVGQRVVVIGNPLGFEGTVSDGIVSAVRDIPAFGKIIQISAPISPGSSGSPVMDMKGRVIGIATFLMTEGQNLNFAIPSQRALKLKPNKPKTFAEWQKGLADELLSLADGVYLRGLVLVWTDNWKKALPFLERAVEKKTQYSRAWFYIGYCRGKQGRHEDAISAFKQAIRVDPNDGRAYANLGVAYWKLGHQREAVSALEEAIRIEPNDAAAYASLSNAYRELGRSEESLSALKKSVTVDRYAIFRENHYRQLSDWKLGHHNEAILALKDAVRIDPTDPVRQLALSRIYCELGQYSQAYIGYASAIHIKPDYAEAHLGLARVYAVFELRDAAISAYKEAIRIAPQNSDVYHELGLQYGELDRHQEAISAYKEAIRLDPRRVVSHLSLGLEYCQIGEKGLAIEEYKILKQLNDSKLTRGFANFLLKEILDE
ncbi:MAG: serine protease [Phycisphaerae bacterium]|nr:serine protease [Phycisphaerae bacterium]